MRTAAQETESNSDTEGNQNEAIALFNSGQDAHERGNLGEALKLYEDALKLFADFPEAEYQRGTALQSLGRAAEAEKSYRRAVELRPDWSLALASLGSLLVRSNNLGEAEKVLSEAVKLDEQNFPAYAALSELYLRANASEENLKNLLLKLRNLTDGKANPPASAWAARGSIERRIGDFAAAKTSLRKALEIEPANPTALFESAELGLRNGDFVAAQDFAQKALATAAPDEKLQAQLLLTRIAADSGNLTEALKILDALDESEKAEPEVQTLRNTIAASSADGAEGIAALEKLLAAEPKNLVALARLCNLTRTVNPQKSLEYCRRASELDPANIGHAVGFGAALVQARQFAPAVELFRKLLAIAPDNYTARQNLAISLYQLKRYAEAIPEYRRLLEARPNLAPAYFFIATAHDNLGEYVEALAAYQKFLQLAEPQQNQLEIDKVKLRLPVVARQVEKGAGKKKP